MDAILPILIALGVVLPAVGFIAVLLTVIRRHKLPDKARLNVLRGLLWFVVIALLADLAVGVILAVSGNLFSSPMWLLTLPPLFTVAVLCASEIRQYQKELAKRRSHPTLR
jgi:vacuolar-type H+-ATPase subunit I/STV1